MDGVSDINFIIDYNNNRRLEENQINETNITSGILENYCILNESSIFPIPFTDQAYAIFNCTVITTEDINDLRIKNIYPQNGNPDDIIVKFGDGIQEMAIDENLNNTEIYKNEFYEMIDILCASDYILKTENGIMNIKYNDASKSQIEFKINFECFDKDIGECNKIKKDNYLFYLSNFGKANGNCTIDSNFSTNCIVDKNNLDIVFKEKEIKLIEDITKISMNNYTKKLNDNFTIKNPTLNFEPLSNVIINQEKIREQVGANLVIYTENGFEKISPLTENVQYEIQFSCSGDNDGKNKCNEIQNKTISLEEFGDPYGYCDINENFLSKCVSNFDIILNKKKRVKIISKSMRNLLDEEEIEVWINFDEKNVNPVLSEVFHKPDNSEDGDGNITSVLPLENEKGKSGLGTMTIIIIIICVLILVAGVTVIIIYLLKKRQTNTKNDITHVPSEMHPVPDNSIINNSKSTN